MDPVCFQEINEKHNAAECPSDGIGPGNGGKPVDELDCDGDIADTNNAPAQQHGEHGNRWLSRTAHDAGNAVGKSHQAIEQADGSHMAGAEVDGLPGVAEEADQLRCKQVRKDANHLCDQAAAGNAEANTLFYTVMLLRAQILTDEGGQCLGKAGYRQEGKTL